jgi:uncharacterized membrane protein
MKFKSPITNINDLQEQKILIQKRLQEMDLKFENHYAEVKKTLQPFNMFKSVVGSIIKPKTSGLAGGVLVFLAEYLIRRQTKNNAIKLPLYTAGIMGAKAAIDLIFKNREVILEKISGLLNKFNRNHQQKEKAEN